MPGTNENNLDAYNEVATTLGGVGGDLNDMVTVRSIAVLEGVSGGPADVNDDNMSLRLNAIDVGAGGPGGHLNTLDALNSIVVLKGGIGGHFNDLDAINEWVDFAAILTFLLRATFDAADQSFVDAQVLDTEAEGVQAGELLVAEPAGDLSIVSNECVFTSGNNLGFFGRLAGGAGFVRGFAMPFLITIQHDNAPARNTRGLGFFEDESFLNARSVISLQMSDGANGIFLVQSGGFSVRTVALYDSDTFYTFVFVLGGSDVNRIPYKAGDIKADFKFGSWCFVKGGAFSTYTLLWQDGGGNFDPIFANFGNNNAVGKLDDYKVVDTDVSAVFQPSALSTFTAANGTSLDAITPEVGPAWIEQSGNWDIQSNRANPDGAAIATVASGEADAVVDCVVNGGTSDNPAIVLRFSDTSNLWYLQADRANDLLELHEVNATVDTVRASKAVTINDSTDFDLRAIADGQTIVGYIDQDDKISYALATLNETEENHGIRSETTLGEFDNFAVFPRTAAIYDTEFDAL